MGHGPGALGPGPRAPRQGPWALGRGPWAMGHEPWAMGPAPWACLGVGLAVALGLVRSVHRGSLWGPCTVDRAPWLLW